MKTLWDRIEIAMSAAAVNMAETARRAEIRPNTLTNWKSGKTERPRRNDIEKVARVLGVSPDWLLTGEGQMLPPLEPLNLQACAREPGGEPYTAPSLDIALLQQALQAALKVAPKETPERLAEVIAQAYDTALRTRRLDKVEELVRMLLS